MLIPVYQARDITSQKLVTWKWERVHWIVTGVGWGLCRMLLPARVWGSDCSWYFQRGYHEQEI